MASLTGLRALSIVHELPLSEAALAAVAALPRLQALAVARKGVHPVLAPGAAAAAATFGDGRHLLALTACTGLTCLRWDQSQVRRLLLTREILRICIYRNSQSTHKTKYTNNMGKQRIFVDRPFHLN